MKNLNEVRTYLRDTYFRAPTKERLAEILELAVTTVNSTLSEPFMRMRISTVVRYLQGIDPNTKLIIKLSDGQEVEIK